MPSRPTNATDSPQWPPRSPHEVLLSTPGGRKRLRQIAGRMSSSPSPSKSRALRYVGSPSARLGHRTHDEDIDDLDDDEDEETLHLKLQAIQAKLKLKKLQAARAQEIEATSQGMDSGLISRPTSAPLGKPGQPRLTASKSDVLLQRPKPQTAIEVPASPIRRVQPVAEMNRSPSRVRLGIDKGLRAQDVSLKKAPSLRIQRSGMNIEVTSRAQDTQRVSQRDTLPGAPRPLSFNERLAGARIKEGERQEKEQRIQKLRTTTFVVGKEEIEEFKSRAVDIPIVPDKPHEYTREEIVGQYKPQNSGAFLKRSNTAPSIRALPVPGSQTIESAASTQSQPSGKNGPTGKTETDASIEPYSGLHLSRRILPHSVVTRAVSAKRCYLLHELYRKVKAPDFALPDDECDIVVFAAVASKSEPRSHKPVLGPDGKPKPQHDRGKYMVLTLVDLKLEVELFLFKTGFERYWKLVTGTVVAILNPVIMPPPRGREATGRWGLIIDSDGDTILEVGTARDLGYCPSARRDGTLCNSWINSKRSQHCEFHTNEAVRRRREERAEVNSLVGYGSAGSKSKWSYQNSHLVHIPEDKTHARSNYDRDNQSRFYVSRASSATLIDREGGFADEAERRAALRRRILANEKEAEVRRSLGVTGNGAGRDYMRQGMTETTSGSTTPASSRGGGGLGSSVSSATLSTATASSGPSDALAGGPMAPPPPPTRLDARSLGLLRTSAHGDIRLSPAKRKRPTSSQSGSTTGLGGGGGALGWGLDLSQKLTRMKSNDNAKLPSQGGMSGERQDGDDRSGSNDGGNQPPLRKKTRFVTAKGIREAGRESLPGGVVEAAKRRRQVVVQDNDDNDDELVIV